MMSLVMVSRLAAACTVSRRGPLLTAFLPFPVEPLPAVKPFALDDTLVSSHLPSSAQDGWRFGERCRLGICGCGVSRPVMPASTCGTGGGPAMTGTRGATARLGLIACASAADAAKMATAATAPAWTNVIRGFE